MKHLAAWLLYLVLFIIRVIAVLVGLVAVPIAYPFRKGRHFPKIFWLWDNNEDGIYGPKWFNNDVKNFKSCYQWSAIRNPANNMRFIDLFNVSHSQGFKSVIYGAANTPDPQLSRKYNIPIWHYTLVKQGCFYYPSYWYLRARKDGTHFRARLGWKCTPEWINTPRAEIYNDSGLTFQFMPYRKG